MSSFSAGIIATLKRSTSEEKYREILADQVQLMMQILFPAGDGIFLDDSVSIHAAGFVLSWFNEHVEEVKHLPRPAQPPDFNIIEPLWSILERLIQNRYPPPESLPELSQYISIKNDHHKDQRMGAALAFLEAYDRHGDSLLDRIVTGDETWVRHVNCETKLQSMHDEAHFWLNGYVNKKNCRIWSEANPQVYVETPLHPEKLTVWCALWAGGIIGPYFFKNDERHNVTVNGDRYRALITNFFIPELNNHDVQELWFQQDGATCHTARATIDLLKDTFGDRLISRFGPVNWPPRSCDLTPLD
ncbi:DDE_3 domain-containing protein [Trichonephila clavipes]|nr:DDE_3 domain-containing protein [Trichonephila clavipes]